MSLYVSVRTRLALSPIFNSSNVLFSMRSIVASPFNSCHSAFKPWRESLHRYIRHRIPHIAVVIKGRADQIGHCLLHLAERLFVVGRMAVGLDNSCGATEPR